jgi:predicted nucleotidyltransferase
MQIPEQDKMIKIIHMFLPNAAIYLFGSFARGDQTRVSDLDIAIDDGKEIPLAIIWRIKAMIEVLPIIPRVDVVDFQSIPKEMQQEILKEGIKWTK